jgi:hypothetical protein
VGGDAIDRDEVDVFDLDRVLTIDPGVAGPDDQMPGPWLDQPAMA